MAKRYVQFKEAKALEYLRCNALLRNTRGRAGYIALMECVFDRRIAHASCVHADDIRSYKHANADR